MLKGGNDWYDVCRYETLLMVAGGIGVSPFVAIIRDLLQRYQRQQNHLPTDVTLIWAVKKSEELQLLDLVSPSSICPQYDLKFNLKVHTFVTQEAEPVPLESGPQTTDRQRCDMFKKSRILSSLYDFEASKRPMSILVGTSSNLWVGMGLLASMLGYWFLENLVVYSYEGFYHHSYNTLPLWARGLFDIMSIILGVVCFGGSVIALWSIWYQFSKQKTEGDSKSTQPLLDADEDITTVANECGDQLIHPSNTQFGHRPDLKGTVSPSPNTFHLPLSISVPPSITSIPCIAFSYHSIEIMRFCKPSGKAFIEV